MHFELHPQASVGTWRQGAHHCAADVVDALESAAHHLVPKLAKPLPGRQGILLEHLVRLAPTSRGPSYRCARLGAYELKQEAHGSGSTVTGAHYQGASAGEAGPVSSKDVRHRGPDAAILAQRTLPDRRHTAVTDPVAELPASVRTGAIHHHIEAAGVALCLALANKEAKGSRGPLALAVGVVLRHLQVSTIDGLALQQRAPAHS
mmetsp:Transcript_32500/g.69207  ORF Transcript_32500/g.69207 Transcript_32500/m.69207 type:complete len:205 (+) Transcript_32500:430-1044(+)